jgi:Ca-activated chloride channel homolog
VCSLVYCCCVFLAVGGIFIIYFHLETLAMSFETTLTFGHPLVTYFLPIAFAGLALLVFFEFKKRKALQNKLIATSLQQSLITQTSKRWWAERVVFVTALLLLLIALAMPQWGYTVREMQSEGLEIIFLLDNSKSMLAEDIKPSRLERAKLAIADLTEKLQGDRLGLITFAGTAFLQCPLTLDHAVFLQSLQATRENPLPQGGSSFGAAIDAGVTALPKDPKTCVLVLISDGEDLSKTAEAASKRAAERDAIIYTIGVGTAAGDLIPQHDLHGNLSYARTKRGQLVKTRLEEKTLRTIAKDTGGDYFALGSTGLDPLYRALSKQFPRSTTHTFEQRIPHEYFMWPLGIALALLIIGIIMPTGRRFRASTLLLLLSWALLFSFTNTGRADSGNDAYEKGDYDSAATKWSQGLDKNPEQAAYSYNLGTTLYKKKDFGAATEAFQKAVSTSKDPSLLQNAQYNLGNAQYRWGESIEDSNLQEAIAHWEESLAAYEAACKLNPEDTEAEHNKTIVKKKLEELKKQKEEKQNQEDKKDDSQKEEKDKSEQKDDSESGNEGSGNSEASDNQNENAPGSSGENESQEKKEPNKAQEKEESQQQKDSSDSNSNEPEETSSEEQTPEQSSSQTNETSQPEKAQQPNPGNTSETQSGNLNGKLTQAQAAALLDSSKEGEKLLPIAINGKDNQSASTSEDW